MRVSLTDLRVKAARAGAHRVDLWDTQMPGLGLRVSPSGHKSWVVRVGRSRHKIGRYPVLTLKDARKKARRILRDGPEVRHPKRPVLFSEVAAEYIATYATPRHSQAWLKREGQYLSAHILPALGRLPTEEVSRGDILRVLDSLADRPTTANMVRSVLSAIFQWAMLRELAPTNPVAGTPPNKLRSRERVLSPDEIRATWIACERDGSLIARSLQVVLATAQRGGEVRAMKWEHVSGRWWEIPVHKSGRAHRAYLSDMVIGILEKLDRRGPWVFPGRFDSGHLRRPHNGVAKIREASGVLGWSVHDLRRTAATRMAELGVRRDVLRRILGHADREVTAIYDRYSYGPEIEAAVRLWSEELHRIVHGHSGSTSFTRV